VRGEGAQVLHDKFRTGKDPGIEALEDEVLGTRIGYRHQEGVVDVALAVFPDFQDLALGGELLGGGKKMWQGLVSAISFLGRLILS